MRLPAALALLVLLLAGCRSRLPWDRPPPPGSWRIEGSGAIPREDLTKAAWYELDLMHRGEHRLADAYDAAYAMERQLRLEGYPEASVTFEDGTGGEIVFQVEAGERARMGRVRFEGLRAFSASRFLPYFQPPATGLFGRGPRWYSEHHVRGAMAAVETQYRAAGYREAEVGPFRAAWNASRTAMDVTVPVVEGSRTVIGRIEIRGDRPDLVPVARWKGRPFQETSAIEIASAIRERLAEDGYVFAEVDIEREFDEARHEADLLFEVRRGERQRLGRVVVPADLKTRPDFIRARIPIRDGEILRGRRLEQGLTALYGTGAFSTMRHELTPRGAGRSDLVLGLEEAESRSLDLGLGWGSWEKLRGTATFRDLNFTGRGRYFQAEARASLRHQGLDLLVEDPWMLGDRNLLSARAAVFHREERFYKFWGIAAEVFVERELSDRLRLRGGYRFEGRDAYEIDPGLSGSELEEVQGFSRSAGPFVQARWDRRDHLFLPTTGWFSTAEVRWSTPALGANLDYVELGLRHSHYWNLGAGWVLGVHNRFATKALLAGRILPIQERYFLGGAESVRSYDHEELTPIDREGQGVGGRTAYEGALEWRKQLVGDLYGAAFVDWGVVSRPAFDLDGAWGWGPGLGLRYYTPVGPVRLDIALNPGERYAATQGWQIHFAFGFSF